MPVASMTSFGGVHPTGGSRLQWQDFSSTRILPLRWRPHPEKLSAREPSHNKTEAKETTAPPTHSRCPTFLFPHPRDKQEEEAAAGTGKQGRTRKAITLTRQHGQRNKKRQTCSLSIRRISLLRPPAAGGEHLPSHSQTTSASTPPSGSTSALCRERITLVGPS